MRIKFEAEARLTDADVIAALDSETYNSKDDIRVNFEGAEFPVEIDGVRFMISVHTAEIDD